ncbi:MAG TPA: DinB family protein [Verrucomicrobiae bacterium]|jgi:uncharacterized damage-inducible protein DinB|nr:DinB family protein [Verrucomicrobiae bacterium]
MRDAVDAVGLARTLVDYNEWATERVLRAADRVPDDLFSQMLPGAGHGSIFGQLRHIAWVQLNYLAGLEANGSAPAEIAVQVKASVDLETRAGIRDAFARGHGGLRAFAAGLTAERWGERQREDAARHLRDAGRPSCPASPGETAALLTELGYSPGDLDFISFTFERPGP